MKQGTKNFTTTGRKVRLALIYSGVLLFVCSCRKDNLQPDFKTDTNGDEVEFTVQMPGLSNVVSTYAITDKEENELQAVDVLAFIVNNKGLANETETFAFRSSGYSISTPNAAIPGTKSFKVSLHKDAANYYRFVVLGNVKNQLDAISLTVGEEKSVMMSKLIYEKNGPWYAESATAYNSFPMWGESSQMIVLDNTGSIGVSLLRSLARIDVSLSGAALSNFVITSVSVMNSRSTGLIAPLAANYKAASGTVTAESLPAVIKYNSDMLTYAVPSPGTSLKQQIYVFESAKSALTINQKSSTELVIGGKYNGSSTITYYKIAFMDAAGNALPVLRNYKYSVNISKVTAAGFPSAFVAGYNIPSSMEVTTIPWDDGGFNFVTTDGQYILAYATDQLEIGGEIGQTVDLAAYTDYPWGFFAESNVDWLDVVEVLRDTKYFFTITAKTSSNIGASGSRTGIITLRTGKSGNNIGRLSRTITVTQRNIK